MSVQDESVTVDTGSALAYSSPRPIPRAPRKQRDTSAYRDPDRFLNEAKKQVVKNHNAHIGSDKPAITEENVFIVWFVKALANWKACLSSPMVPGYFWEVSYAGLKKELYIDVYRKVTNVVVSLKEGAS